LAGSNAVESAATLMEFVAALHLPRYGPGTDYNTVATPPTAIRQIRVPARTPAAVMSFYGE